jgi:hypothetical protein
MQNNPNYKSLCIPTLYARDGSDMILAMSIEKWHKNGELLKHLRAYQDDKAVTYFNRAERKRIVSI